MNTMTAPKSIYEIILISARAFLKIIGSITKARAMIQNCLVVIMFD